MSEFELIRHYFAAAACAQAADGVVLGIGDDCALLQVPAGEQLAVSTDTLVAGVHFPAGAPGELLGQRALAVAVSDLAAMGATPLAFTLALTLPFPKFPPTGWPISRPGWNAWRVNAAWAWWGATPPAGH